MGGRSARRHSGLASMSSTLYARSMLARTRTTMLLTAAVLTAVGAIVGAVVEPLGVLRGAALGLMVTVAASVHLAVRTLAVRTPEAQGPEYAEESVERQAIASASARVAPDAVSIATLVALGCLLADSIVVLRALPLAGLIAVLVDFGLRIRGQWKVRIGTDA